MTFSYDSDPKPMTAQDLYEALRAANREIAKPQFAQPSFVTDLEVRAMLGQRELRDSAGHHNDHVLGFIAYGNFDAVWAWGTR